MERRLYSVGATTATAALSDEVKRYKARTFESEVEDNRDTENRAKETLVSKCIRAITTNFADRPQLFDGLPAEFVKVVTRKLPTNLDIICTGPYIYDENYWKRCCLEHPVCLCILLLRFRASTNP